jgi:ATP-binding cassette subfamily F protein uup
VKPAGRPGKLSYKDQRELDALPARIEALEAEQTRLHATVNDAGFYQRPVEEVQATLARLEVLASELESCYERWGILDVQSTDSP